MTPIKAIKNKRICKGDGTSFNNPIERNTTIMGVRFKAKETVIAGRRFKAMNCPPCVIAIKIQPYNPIKNHQRPV